jgi:hypothetical protein
MSLFATITQEEGSWVRLTKPRRPKLKPAADPGFLGTVFVECVWCVYGVCVWCVRERVTGNE